MTLLPTLFGDFWDAILAYVFLYPVLMSVVWMIGGMRGYCISIMIYTGNNLGYL